MSDNFLKNELDAESKAAKKRRIILFICIAIFVPALSVGVAAWGQRNSDDNDNINVPTVVDANKGKTDSDVIAKGDTPVTDKSKQAPLRPSASKSSPSEAQAYSPKPQSINKAAFISDSNTVMAHYSQIVDLVNFPPSMTDSEKAHRIKQAVALDDKYFGQTTDLRSNLVWAGVTNGPYMQATELAESGVSKISVGLDTMNEWVNDRSRTSSLDGGLGYVRQGSQILLEFSHKVDSL